MNPLKRNRRAKAKRRYNTLARQFGVSSPVERTTQTGNRDHGCPFKGKDLFSGMMKHYKDRVFIDEEG
jgi:hypothetical protein